MTPKQNKEKNKSSGQIYICKFYQTFREELLPLILRLSQNVEEMRILPNIVYGTIMLILKSDRDTTKKENYKSISLINIDAKSLTKY